MGIAIDYLVKGYRALRKMLFFKDCVTCRLQLEASYVTKKCYSCAIPNLICSFTYLSLVDPSRLFFCHERIKTREGGEGDFKKSQFHHRSVASSCMQQQQPPHPCRPLPPSGIDPLIPMFNKWIVDDLENIVPYFCVHMTSQRG